MKQHVARKEQAREARWGAALVLVSLALGSCGGGGGSPPPPESLNPVPSVTALFPSSQTAGGTAFNLTVTGTNFVSGAVVRWNGSDRTTTFSSSTQLTAQINSPDLATAGAAEVTVFNPAPSGGVSNSLAFTINNPVPTVASLSPSSAVATGPGFTLTLDGSNFVPSSVARWNGADRSTTFVSKTKLTAMIPASDVVLPGAAQVSVINPEPGGGTSAALTFSITPLTPPRITTTRLPDTGGGKSYNFVLASTGGAPPITWSLDSGALPANATLDVATGRISGTVSGVGGDTTANFTVRATDSVATPQTTTRPLSILVRAPPLGRNDSDPCSPGSTPTAISNGRIRASISPYGDLDVYAFHGTGGAQVTIEIFAQRLDLDGDPSTRDSHLDSLVELLDSNCTVFTFSDDIDSGVIQDSLIQNFALPSTGTYFIWVRDFRGDGRPDLIYDLSLSGAD